MKTILLFTIAMAWLNPEWKEDYDKRHEFKKREHVETHNVPDNGNSIILLAAALGSILVYKSLKNENAPKR